MIEDGAPGGLINDAQGISLSPALLAMGREGRRGRGEAEGGVVRTGDAMAALSRSCRQERTAQATKIRTE
jgi:hypothetical protein